MNAGDENQEGGGRKGMSAALGIEHPVKPWTPTFVVGIADVTNDDTFNEANLVDVNVEVEQCPNSIGLQHFQHVGCSVLEEPIAASESESDDNFNEYNESIFFDTEVKDGSVDSIQRPSEYDILHSDMNYHASVAIDMNFDDSNLVAVPVSFGAEPVIQADSAVQDNEKKPDAFVNTSVQADSAVQPNVKAHDAVVDTSVQADSAVQPNEKAHDAVVDTLAHAASAVEATNDKKPDTVVDTLVQSDSVAQVVINKKKPDADLLRMSGSGTVLCACMHSSVGLEELEVDHSVGLEKLGVPSRGSCLGPVCHRMMNE